MNLVANSTPSLTVKEFLKSVNKCRVAHFFVAHGVFLQLKANSISHSALFLQPP